MFRGRTVAVVIPACNEADKIAATVHSVPGLRRSRHRRRRRQHRRDRGDRPAHRRAARSSSTSATAASAPRSRPATRARSRSARRRPPSWRATARWIPRTCPGCSRPSSMARPTTPREIGSRGPAAGARCRRCGCWAADLLSWLTRLASGYWRIGDSQCGYTVASRRALLAIGSDLFPRYGYPNDLLAKLGAARARVVDVPVRPVYGPAWRSGLRPLRVALPIAWLLARGFFRRVCARWRGAPSIEAAPLRSTRTAGAGARHEDRSPHHVVSPPRRRLRRQLRRRSRCTAARGRSHGRRPGGGRRRRRPRDSSMSGRPSRGSPLTPTLSPPGEGERAEPVLRRGRARGAGARRRARLVRGGAFLVALAAEARARARIASTSSNRTGWSRARSPRSRPPQRIASARSPIRATSRCSNGSRSGAPSRGASPAPRSRSSSSARLCRRGSRARGPRRQVGDRRAGGRSRGPWPPRAGIDVASRRRLGLARPPCSRSAGWSRSRATSGSCTRARASRPRRHLGRPPAGGRDPGRRTRTRPPRPARPGARRSPPASRVRPARRGGALVAGRGRVRSARRSRLPERPDAKGRRSRPPRRARSGFRCSSRATSNRLVQGLGTDFTRTRQACNQIRTCQASREADFAVSWLL